MSPEYTSGRISFVGAYYKCNSPLIFHNDKKICIEASECTDGLATDEYCYPYKADPNYSEPTTCGISYTITIT